MLLMAQSPQMPGSDVQNLQAAKALVEILKAVKQDYNNVFLENVTSYAGRVLLEGLGLRSEQFLEQYRCGEGPVDFAASYTADNFALAQQDPQILLELKKPGTKFHDGTEDYLEVSGQLKRYMGDRYCQSVEHGIIFNGHQIQIFSKSGEVVNHATKVIDLMVCLEEDKPAEAIGKILDSLKEIIINQPQIDPIPIYTESITEPFVGESLLKRLQEISKDGPRDGAYSEIAEILLCEGLNLRNNQFQRLYKYEKEPILPHSYIADGSTQGQVDAQVRLVFLELQDLKTGFNYGTEEYFDILDQLKEYLNKASHRNIEHVIILNISQACFQIQVFRRHGELIYPITQAIDFMSYLNLKEDNSIKEIEKTMDYLKNEIISKDSNLKSNRRFRGTIMTIWNNKGGVGKTTTAFMLSLMLSNPSKHTKNKILAIDFDHNQGDLSKYFEVKASTGKTKELLLHMLESDNIKPDYQASSIHSIPVRNKESSSSIDILPADKLLNSNKTNYQQDFGENNLILRRLCLVLAEDYDYIVIDAPPNYRDNVYAQEAINAADCLLAIGCWSDLSSLLNYHDFLLEDLPKVRDGRKDGGPENLGIWINKWEEKRFPNKNKTYSQTIDNIKKWLSEANQDKQEELRRAFLDKEGELRLIHKHAAIGKVLFNERRLRIPWQVSPKKAYQALFSSILMETN